MCLGGLQACLQADGSERWPVGRAGTLAGGVLEPEVDGIHADSLGEFVDHGLAGEHGLRCAGCPVGGDARAVDHHLVALDEYVVDVVRRENAHRAGPERATGKGARLVDELGVHGDDGAVAFAADLGRVDRSGCRAGGAEHVLAGHHHLHGPAALFGQFDREGFQVDRGLAAESSADLAGDDADVALVHAERHCRHASHPEMTLGAAPDRRLAILVEIAHAGVRLDVALVDHRRHEGAFDDLVGLGERRVDVPLGDDLLLDEVGGRRGRFRQALGDEIVVQDRRVRPQGLPRVGDRSEHFVVNDHGFGGRFGGLIGSGRDGGDRVAVVERLLAGKEVLVEPLAAEAEIGPVGKVGGGDDCQNAGHGLGGGCVDRTDARVGVRTAHDLAVQHAGQGVVGTEVGAPRYLFQPVGPNRSCTDVFQSLCGAHAPSLVRCLFNYTMETATSVFAWLNLPRVR